MRQQRTKVSKALKKFISITLALIMVLGVMPLNLVYGTTYNITSINLFRTFESFSDIGKYTVSIRGSGLRSISVMYLRDGGEKFEPFSNEDRNSTDSLRQFEVDPGVIISEIMVGEDTFTINETNMPKITSANPTQVDLEGKEPQIELTGNNFDKFKQGETTLSISISNQDLTPNFTEATNNSLTLEKDDNGDKKGLKSLGYGIKNIVITNKKIESSVNGNNVEIITRYNQNNAFRLYESIDLNEGDVTIYPNRGQVGTPVNITMKNHKKEYSVFFLEDETKPFMYENMGEDPYYPQTTDNDGRLVVKVPKGLTTGKTYKVVVTNKLDSVKKPGMDLTGHVTAQKTIGEFYVVDANVGPYIIKTDPSSGTNAGAYVTIYGYRFEELKISRLEGVSDVITDPEENLEILKGGEDDPTKLRIKYKVDENAKYNGAEVSSVTRDFLVTIGRDALFENEHLGKQVFEKGDSKEDELYVKTKTIEEVGKKDVVIQIDTIITTVNGDGDVNKEKFTFTEVAVLPNGYEFLPSTQNPQIEKVIPDKIQVENDLDPVTINDTILSIQGNGFNVFRYLENGEMKTNYPKVVLGSATEGTGEIIVEKKADGKVYYSTKTKNESGDFEGAIFEVLDKNGNIVTGIGGNDEGTSIILTVPKGLKISTNNVNTNLPVAVANPKRDSSERGIYSYKNDVLSFVTVLSSPIIEEVDPYIVTIEGGEDVVIKGSNFNDGIKIFIDGVEVSNVTRDIDKESTRGTLRFKAPPGREGTNIVQIMNPDGGSDTHEFIYVQTMRIDPIITSINPPKGTKDTLIVIKGDNFLKPDQTVSSIEGLGLYRLIGSRVFLNNEDVNKYITFGEGLEDYESPDVKDEPLFSKEKNFYTNLYELVLSPYYKSAILSESVDEDTGNGRNYYVINIDYEGNPVIIGKDENYTLKLLNGDIKAIDEAGKIFDVILDLDKNTLTIKSQDAENEDMENENTESEEKTVVINIFYDYKLFSIGKNEFGYSYLKVADYYDSLILQEDENFYTIEIDDTEKVTLSDGKNNTYEIRLDKDGEIVAVKDSTSEKVDVNNDYIVIGNEKTLNFKTLFAVDADTGIIIGHRAKVKNRNEIWVTIPEKGIPGFYDVTVRNPDTKNFTVRNGFEYLIPQSEPKINYISPNQGSVEGGYEITIYGEGFQNTTEVYIAGEKVPNTDVKVDTVNYTSINVTVPRYPGDVNTDFIIDRKYVLVTVLNEDGGSDSKDNLFAYVLASSRPRIDKINPASGTAAGGDVVEIWGYDFRYFEPYKGERPGDGDTNFEDLDRDGKWTRYSTDRDVPEKFRKSIEDKNLIDRNISEYIDSPVLPKIYFGKEEAKIIEFKEGYIKVITPRSTTLGPTDVYLLNNDAGISNKVRFTYEGSNPNIRVIIPNVGRKQGGEKVDIEGSNFKVNNIDVINRDNKQQKISNHLIRFGNVSNINIPREAENSGLINQGVATVHLDGGLKVEYKVDNGSSKIIVSITEDGTTYTRKYDYDSGVKYIDVRGLKKDDKSYTGYELIKIEVDDGRLLVTRGYSPKATEKYTGQLEVVTPTYYSVGNVDVVVENPDGISNKVIYQYKNPDSYPKIINITRDGQQPQPADDGERNILTVNIKGGSEIVIEGSDFRDVQRIQIGNVLNVESGDILVNEPNRLVFKMPAVGDGHATAFLHRVVVTNYDGGVATSDKAHPPIYIQFTKGESNPEIESITPPRGPDTGGNTVIMKGKDFREIMDGYAGEKLKVYFDGKQVPHSDVRVIDYKTISVIAPPGKPGSVEVKVENPDGEMSNTVQYTYASNPKITSVVDPLDTTKKAVISTISIEGNQEIKLKGTGFMENARVYFAPKVTPATGTEQVTGRIIYIQGNPYILEEGTEGTNFEFIDDRTVTIKTPALKAGSSGVIIVNPDDGASPIYKNLIYGLPEIAAPTGVVAELVYDRFIRVHWGAVSGATEYEIFVVVDDKTTELIGSTRLTSFAYNDLEPRTRYKFIVKAVGDFGSSKPSLESNTVRTGRVAGPPDEDGELAENTAMSKTGNTANIVIGTRDRGTTPIVIDLTRGNLAGSTEVVISMPADVILQSGSRNIQVTGKDFSLNFKLSAFNVANVRENRNRSDAGVRFVITPYVGNTQVASGNQLSTVYNLDATVYAGKTNAHMDYLADSINLVLDYDTQKANLRRLNSAGFSYFSPETNSWQPVSFSTSTTANSVSGVVDRLGRYTVVGSRR